MDNPTSQAPNKRSQDTSFDPPDDGTGGTGGKTAGSASGREVSFDPPDDGTGGTGGKTAGSAPAREN